MNIFEQLLKPFMKNTRPQENIDFEAEPSVHDPKKTDIRPVMFIKASTPAITTISAPLQSNHTTHPQTKIRKSSTSSTTSSGISWPFRRKSGQIIPEEASVKKQLSEIKEASYESNEIISRKNSPIPHTIHPYQMLLDTLYGDPEENLDDYDFHCTNISENLKPYIKKHNHLVDDIKNANTYNTIIETSNLRSISCPNIVSISWKPPNHHGLQNSQRIIPDYYFQTHHNIQKICDDKKRNALLEIDYLFMIKDDIRNMRKLNQYQIDYIQTLDEATKDEIIREFHAACNMMIETISMIRSRETSPRSSYKELLNDAKYELCLSVDPEAKLLCDTESHSHIRTHMPRTSTI